MNHDAERSRGFEIDDHLEQGRSLNRTVGGFRTFQYPVDEIGGATKAVMLIARRTTGKVRVLNTKKDLNKAPNCRLMFGNAQMRIPVGTGHSLGYRAGVFLPAGGAESMSPLDRIKRHEIMSIIEPDHQGD